MHCVLPLVEGSLAPEDLHQEMGSDPRVEMHNLIKRLYTIQKPATEVTGPALLQFYAPIRKRIQVSLLQQKKIVPPDILL